jgi:hypothetical protein
LETAARLIRNGILIEKAGENLFPKLEV